MLSIETITEGLTFPEGPRWRGGKLWFSDFYSCNVFALSLNGELEKQFQVPNRPSGLGWTPAGDILVVSMLDRKLLRWDGSYLSEVADLSALTNGCCNDMVVAEDGTAFVGEFGFDIYNDEEFRPAKMICVHPSGHTEIAAEDLHFPNGAVITDDEKTLIVAETFGKRLTAFDMDKEGTLSNRRVWADLGPYSPDGICKDDSDGIWVAAPSSGALFRVEEGGNITHELAPSQDAYSCAITHNNDALLVCTSAYAAPDECRQYCSGRIEKVNLTTI